MDIRIESMSPHDWGDVRRIYAAGIATGDATFETEAPPWERWDATHRPAERFVARSDAAILGWAALSPVSDRCVYGGVAEVSVYVSPDARGQGVGAALLHRLIEASETGGVWTLQAGIFPENRASVALHERLGFRQVGRRERLGKMNGAWRDVLLFERRSTRVGV